MSVSSANDGISSEPKVQKIVSVVPWYNADEFKKVYQNLYSDNLDNKKKAYDTISVWDTRCHPSLPAAIEASYVLTSAVIQDILWTNQKTLVHYTDMQSIYGSAVTRFVSLTVEVHQDYYNHSRSAAEIAKGLGIPSFIVDARNEWCHSSRPSLSVLRSAAQAALKYLKVSYWEIEAARVKNLVKEPWNDGELKSLLFDYVIYKYRILCEGKSSLNNGDSKLFKEKHSSYLIKFENWIRKNKRLFVKVLVQDGIFIPLEEELKHWVSEEVFSKFQAECNEDDFDDDDDVDVDEESVSSYICERFSIPDIPNFHEELWTPVIHKLHKYDAVSIFMESLLRSLGHRTVAGQKLIIAWVLKILRIHASAGCMKPSCLKRVFHKKGLVANWKSMFYSAVINPCKYATVVLPLIFSHMELEKVFTVAVLNQLAIFLGQAKCDSGQISQIYTAKDVQEGKARQKAEKARQLGKFIESIWSLCKDNHHKSWPIGYIINAAKDEENEEQQIEEDLLQCFMENADFTERFLPSNKNDEEDFVMDVDSPDIVLPDFEKVTKEMGRQKSFLYKK